MPPLNWRTRPSTSMPLSAVMARDPSGIYLSLSTVWLCYICVMSTSTVSGTAAREAWALFWRIFTADKPRRMATMNELGLAPMQSMALMRLRPGEPMTMSAMAHALMCDNSNVTGIVDRLVKTLVITDKGTATRAEVERRLSVPPPPLAGLSEDDAAALRDILQRA